jgi:hypothetical protein
MADEVVDLARPAAGRRGGEELEDADHPDQDALLIADSFRLRLQPRAEPL